MTEPHNNQPSPPPAQPSPVPPAQPSPAPAEIQTARASFDVADGRAELELLRRRVRELPEEIARAIESEQPEWARDPDIYASGVLFGMMRAAVITRRFSHT